VTPDHTHAATTLTSIHVITQVGTFWQDDLQSVVHMDIGQSQEIAPTSSNSYNGMNQRPIRYADTSS
jgi:hypothetical protein